jgi:hypothetical protein
MFNGFFNIFQLLNSSNSFLSSSILGAANSIDRSGQIQPEADDADSHQTDDADPHQTSSPDRVAREETVDVHTGYQVHL